MSRRQIIDATLSAAFLNVKTDIAEYRVSIIFPRIEEMSAFTGHQYEICGLLVVVFWRIFGSFCVLSSA